MSDFPMPDDYPNFPSHEEIRAYLEAYCARFSLTERIRFNRRVTRVSKRGDLWQITTADGGQWLASRVIVSSGVHQLPNDASGDDRFRGYAGTLLHSAAVKDVPRQWSGKTVVVWGGGGSARDIAGAASRDPAGVHFCLPDGVWGGPKGGDHLPGVPRPRREGRD